MSKCDLNKVSVISIKLQSKFIEITLRHGCSPVNLLHIFRTSFLKNTYGWLLLFLWPCRVFVSIFFEKKITNILLWNEAINHLRKVNNKCTQQEFYKTRDVLLKDVLFSVWFMSSRPELFLRKSVLKIYLKFTGEHPCRSVISLTLLCNFTEITLRHGCSPVNLLHNLRKPFSKNTSGWMVLMIQNFLHNITS